MENIGFTINALQVNVCLCRLVEYLVKENPSCIPLENRQSPKGCQTTLQIPWKEHPILSFTRFETFHNFCWQQCKTYLRVVPPEWQGSWSIYVLSPVCHWLRSFNILAFPACSIHGPSIVPWPLKKKKKKPSGRVASTGRKQPAVCRGECQGELRRIGGKEGIHSAGFICLICLLADLSFCLFHISHQNLSSLRARKFLSYFSLSPRHLAYYQAHGM